MIGHARSTLLRGVGLALGLSICVALGATTARTAPGVMVGACAGCAVVVGLAAIGALTGAPPSEMFVWCGIAAAGLVDILAGQKLVGGFSAQAVVTCALTAAGIGIVIAAPAGVLSRMPTPTRFLLAYCVWAFTTLLWAPISVQEVQNLLIYVVFAVTIVVGAIVGARGPGALQRSTTALNASMAAAYALFGVTVVSERVGGPALVGNRAFGLVGLLAVAWWGLGWRFGARLGREMACLGVGLVFLSLSRTAAATAVLILALCWYDRRRLGGSLKVVSVLALGGVVGVGAVLKIGALHSRFFSGDLRSVGGFSVNLTGRETLWRETWNSYLSAPVVGHGAGSADLLITRLNGAAAGHPHNDYLRILHDTGAVGMALWIVGYVGLMWVCSRAWRGDVDASHEAARVHGLAFLGLLGVALGMVTDNVVIYLYVMAPLGCIAGLSLGARSVEAGGQAGPSVAL